MDIPFQRNQKLSLSNQERGYYSGLFSSLSPQSHPIPSKQVVQFFKQSNIQIAQLKQIWIQSCESDSQITRDEFYVALKYIALAQKNIPLTPQNLQMQTPLPLFQKQFDKRQYQDIFQKQPWNKNSLVIYLETLGSGAQSIADKIVKGSIQEDDFLACVYMMVQGKEELMQGKSIPDFVQQKMNQEQAPNSQVQSQKPADIIFQNELNLSELNTTQESQQIHTSQINTPPKPQQFQSHQQSQQPQQFQQSQQLQQPQQPQQPKQSPQQTLQNKQSQQVFQPQKSQQLPQTNTVQNFQTQNQTNPFIKLQELQPQQRQSQDIAQQKKLDSSLNSLQQQVEIQSNMVQPNQYINNVLPTIEAVTQKLKISNQTLQSFLGQMQNQNLQIQQSLLNLESTVDTLHSQQQMYTKNIDDFMGQMVNEVTFSTEKIMGKLGQMQLKWDKMKEAQQIQRGISQVDQEIGLLEHKQIEVEKNRQQNQQGPSYAHQTTGFAMETKNNDYGYQNYEKQVDYQEPAQNFNNDQDFSQTKQDFQPQNQLFGDGFTDNHQNFQQVTQNDYFGQDFQDSNQFINKLAHDDFFEPQEQPNQQQKDSQRDFGQHSSDDEQGGGVFASYTQVYKPSQHKEKIEEKSFEAIQAIQIAELKSLDNRIHVLDSEDQSQNNLFNNIKVQSQHSSENSEKNIETLQENNLFGAISQQHQQNQQQFDAFETKKSVEVPQNNLFGDDFGQKQETFQTKKSVDEAKNNLFGDEFEQKQETEHNSIGSIVIDSQPDTLKNNLFGSMPKIEQDQTFQDQYFGFGGFDQQEKQESKNEFEIIEHDFDEKDFFGGKYEEKGLNSHQEEDQLQFDGFNDVNKKQMDDFKFEF